MLSEFICQQYPPQPSQIYSKEMWPPQPTEWRSGEEVIIYPEQPAL